MKESGGTTVVSSVVLTPRVTHLGPLYRTWLLGSMNPLTPSSSGPQVLKLRLDLLYHFGLKIFYLFYYLIVSPYKIGVLFFEQFTIRIKKFQFLIYSEPVVKIFIFEIRLTFIHLTLVDFQCVFFVLYCTKKVRKTRIRSL